MSGVERDLQQQLQHLEALIHELEQGPESPARARAREIVRAVLDLHTLGLASMLRVIAGAGASGSALMDAFGREPVITGLLLLHGLHPDDLETRVRGAVQALEPMLQAQGARVALLSIMDGAVRLVLEREMGRGRVAGRELRTNLEHAILAAAPDAGRLDIDVPDTADLAAFVPVDQVRMRPDPRQAHE